MKRTACVAVIMGSAASFVMAQSEPYMFVFLNTNPNKAEVAKEQVDSLMKGHMANIDRLAKEGKLIAAGPFHGGGGIFVLSTGSLDTAREWLRTDPGIRANRWIVEMMTYRPRVGSVCTVGEKFEMVGYGFVRYTALVGRPVLADNSHLDFLKEVVPVDSIVAEGVLGEGEGSILVVKGEPDERRLKEEPAFVTGSIAVSVRKLWIARGAFCEE